MVLNSHYNLCPKVRFPGKARCRAASRWPELGRMCPQLHRREAGKCERGYRVGDVQPRPLLPILTGRPLGSQERQFSAEERDTGVKEEGSPRSLIPSSFLPGAIVLCR